MKNGKQELLAWMERTEKIKKARRNFELEIAIINLAHPIKEENTGELLV